MMIIIRKAGDRGNSRTPWLNSCHTFSFADYYDPSWMHFGNLRVINEDYIKPSQGFGMHPHRDMEIITYVAQGSLKHQDNMGNGSIILPGEIQRMSAGTGVMHSEFNNSSHEELHLLQIWILPKEKGLAPSYEQKKITKNSNQLILIGANKPNNHAVKIHQDIELYVGFFEKNKSFTYQLNSNKAWLQLIKGHIKVNDEALNAGDGIGIKGEKQLIIHCIEPAEFLLFSML